MAELQGQVLPLPRNGFRDAAGLSQTLSAKADAWAGLLRAETRGTHVRHDLPGRDLPQWRQRIVWQGLAARPTRQDIAPFAERAAA